MACDIWRLRAFRVACPGPPAGPGTGAVIAVAAVAPDPIRCRPPPAAHKAWMSQPRRPGGMNAASTPYGLVLAGPAGQAGLQRPGRRAGEARPGGRAPRRSGRGGRSAVPGMQPPAVKISDDVRAYRWSLSRGGALNWPDGWGIYQRRLYRAGCHILTIPAGGRRPAGRHTGRAATSATRGAPANVEGWLTICR